MILLKNDLYHQKGGIHIFQNWYIHKVTNSRKNLKFSKTLLGQNGVMLDISYDVMNQRKYILLYYTVLEIWGSGARV